MNSWFILANILDSYEEDEFYKIFRKCQKNLDSNTCIYIILVYKKKRAKLIHITQNDTVIIGNYTQKDYGQTYWFTKLINIILKYIKKNKDPKPIAFSYYGHGGGVVIGPWNDPLMTINKFTNIFLKKLTPKFVAFDSCYLGSIVSLYEVAKYTDYAIASPSWHPYTSIATMPLFGKLPKSKEGNSNIKQYIIDLTCQFGKVKNQPKYACLIAFDLEKLWNVVPKIKKLVFKETANLKQHDPNQYDLLLSVEKSIQSEIKQVVLSKNCLGHCPLNIHGISHAKPNAGDAWEDYLDKTRWGKFLKTVKITNFKL
jgi:hypothetical protein